MRFEDWLVKYLGCEWEDYEGNLGDSDMERAFEAGYLEAQRIEALRKGKE